jgi:hypothetical protein
MDDKEKQETKEMAEEILRIELMLNGALVRMNERRPAGNDEWARKWRVSAEHLTRARDYWQWRIMADPLVSKLIDEVREQAIQQAMALPPKSDPTAALPDTSPEPA